MHEPFKLVRYGEPWSILWNWIEIIPTYPKQNIVQTKEKKLGITIEHQIKKNTSFAENETCSAPASAFWDPFVVAPGFSRENHYIVTT